MADEGKEVDLGAAPGQKTSKLLTLIMVLNLGATGVITMKVLGLPDEPVVVTAPEEEEDEDAEESDIPGPVHSFEPFLVNLNEPGGGRFLRATVEIEVIDEEALTALTEVERRVKDEILRYLSNLKVADTMGEDNRLEIQEGIIARVDKQLGEEERVKRVYFADFVVQ